jgi:hypothetical protein
MRSDRPLKWAPIIPYLARDRRLGKDHSRAVTNLCARGTYLRRRSRSSGKSSRTPRWRSLRRKWPTEYRSSTSLQKVYNPVDVETGRSIDCSCDLARCQRKANELCHSRRSGNVTRILNGTLKITAGATGLEPVISGAAGLRIFQINQESSDF